MEGGMDEGLDFFGEGLRSMEDLGDGAFGHIAGESITAQEENIVWADREGDRGGFYKKDISASAQGE
jgi:hypothetical protein